MTDEGRSFNYPVAMKELCRDACRRLPTFRHIDVEKIGFSLGRANNRDSRYGRWAWITPLFFEGGALATAVEKKRRLRFGEASIKVGSVVKYYKCPVVLSPDRKTRLKYLFSIMTPRFYNLTVEEKLETIMHELYHIDETFNGDVRRFPGRNWQHGSKKRYSEICLNLKEKWLASDPDPRLYNFLQWNEEQLFERYESIIGWRYPGIKLIEITFDEAVKLNPKLSHGVL